MTHETQVLALRKIMARQAATIIQQQGQIADAKEALETAIVQLADANETINELRAALRQERRKEDHRG